MKGEQHWPEFLAINPNAKTPAIVDDGVRVFDSTAILIYLAEKAGMFLPDRALRGETLSWLMFVATGLGPYNGQYGHFTHFAPQPYPYALARYEFEAKRHWGILNDHLAGREWMVGDSYSIVDMTVWGWSRFGADFIGDDAWKAMSDVRRLYDKIESRPAAERTQALMAKHAFKADLDADAKKILFPGTASLMGA